ncbi:hypothetical protein ZOSMA_7216G00010, partial [Zostera marina]
MFSWLLVIKDRRNHDLIVEGHTDGNHMVKRLKELNNYIVPADYFN